jgi:peptide/nickel transport system ATP-binding protein
MSEVEPVLRVSDLWKSYPRKQSLWRRLTASEVLEPFHAVAGVEFALEAHECLGLVGESGSGKTTLSRIIAGLLPASRGRLLLDGKLRGEPDDTSARTPGARARVQMVFQDPTESLNPSFTARRTIAEPLSLLRGMQDPAAIRSKVDELADLVQLPRTLLDRYPHQLSGGQRARVGIARAIAPSPRVLLLDEPTTALDVSVQAKILLLLDDRKRRLDMSMILVTHDLSVVRLLCDRVMVLKEGRVVEAGAVSEVMAAPQHAYTRTLLDALPQMRRPSRIEARA